jgi:radical SAM superfamily enzyme YgiQ (UPF0313 family)
MGLGFLGAAPRRGGHRVAVHVRQEVLEKNGFDWDAADAELLGILREMRPDVVGLSVFTPGMPEAAAIAALVKRTLSRQVLVVAGGPHPTALAEETLQESPDMDVVVLGEGEETLVELVDHGPSESVRGIVFRKGDRLIRTDHRPTVTDLDRLGRPAYELFDMKYYTQPGQYLIRWLELSGTNIRTSRGCSNRCRFCAGHVVSGLGLRYHSLPYVIEQMVYAAEELGVQAIRFEDDTLGADPSRLLELCQEIRRAGLHRRLRWEGCLRTDQVDANLLGEMKSAGCIQVEYGFESGSGESLRRLGKNTTTDLNRRAVRLTRQVGLRIFADIMIGLPGETEEDLRQTVRFVQWARPDVLASSRLCPLPGTAIFDALPAATRASLDWAGYAYLDRPGTPVNLTAMSDDTLQCRCRQFQKYVARPHMLWALLRDAPPQRVEYRRRLRRDLRRFMLHHPIHAARLLW